MRLYTCSTVVEPGGSSTLSGVPLAWLQSKQ